MKEYDKAVAQLGQDAADQFMKIKAELVAMGKAEDGAKFEEWLSQRSFIPHIRRIDLHEPLISRMMTGQAVSGFILFMLDEEYIVMLGTGTACDVFKANDFMDLGSPPYGKYVFRPMMGYKSGLLVSRYLLKHNAEVYAGKLGVESLSALKRQTSN